MRFNPTRLLVYRWDFEACQGNHGGCESTRQQLQTSRPWRAAVWGIVGTRLRHLRCEQPDADDSHSRTGAH